MFTRKNFLAACLLAAPLALSGILPAAAATTVKVTLGDMAADADLSQNLGMGMGMHADMGKAPLSIRTDVASVPAGKVIFEVTNTSKELIHEMLIAPVKDASAVLPYDGNEGRIDEESSGDLGEVADLDPGKTGTLTLNLKPGIYLLFCNTPGHYMAGMWTLLTIEG